MKIEIYLINVVLLVLFQRALSQYQKQDSFMEKYKEAIQRHIMSGHEEQLGQNCDTLSSNPSHKGELQITMGLGKIKNLNMKSAFASSNCLLINYVVESETSLSILLDFCWDAINYIRLALIVEFQSNITLDVIKNTTKIPFLVAAQSNYGEEFLCPVIGEEKPRLQKVFCETSDLSYVNKKLRIGLVGPMPQFIYKKDGLIDGSSYRLIQMIANRFNFKLQIQVANSPQAAESLVGPTDKIIVDTK